MTKKLRVKMLDESDNLHNASHSIEVYMVGKTKVYVFNDDGLYFTLYFSREDFDNDVRGVRLSSYDKEDEDDDDYEDTLADIQFEEMRKAVLKHEKKAKTKRRK